MALLPASRLGADGKRAGIPKSLSELTSCKCPQLAPQLNGKKCFGFDLTAFWPRPAP